VGSPPDTAVLDVSIKELKNHVDLKFASMYQLLEEKLKPLPDIKEDYKKLERRVDKIERWQAYMCGGAAVLGAMLKTVWDYLCSR